MRTLAFLLLLPLALSAQQEPPLTTLTTARELRSLSPVEAARAYPVRLQATVTLVEPNGTVFLRDDTGATFLRASNRFAEMRSGQRIEVEGETFAGLYVTGIIARRTEILSGGAPPEPRPLNFEELASGQFHYEWVVVQGIVRAFIPGEYPVVKLALGNGAIDLFPVTENNGSAEHLIDATVRVTGLAAGFINDRRQLVAPHLRLRSLEDISALEPAPAEPFAIPATPAAELLRFAPGGRPGHRVKVRGTVMHHEPGAAIWLRDGDQGLRVRSATLERFAPGEVVDALGFPVMGTFSAELDDAVFQRTGETVAVAPVPSTIKELLSGQRDADLVTVEADVRDVVREGERLTLALQAEGTVFLAFAQPYPADADVPAPGARVRVTGVCRVVGSTQPARSFSTRPQSFTLLLRSLEDDLAVLRRPPWWNAQRLTIATGALLALALLAGAWAALLRRQVRRQTELIRAQVAEAAIADERQRIAREFHDTLEQELVGVSLRLDAATTRASEPKLRDLLTATQRLIHQLQTGARSFVWNLRDTALAGQPLAGAIAQAIANLAAGRQVEVRTTGEARRLPETVGHELLRVAQEATTNAVKHGGAKRIAITLDFTAEKVRLTAHDDGAGFDPTAPVPAGHFGLLGMRERVQKLGGEFTMRSAPGTGTTIEVTVPLPS